MNARVLSKRSFVLLSLLIATASTACGGTKKAPPPPPPATVLVTEVVRRDLPLFVETVGSLDGYVNADIRARVKGYLKAQTYKDGSTVKAGRTLFTIEQSDYEAAVALAQSNVARAKAIQDRNNVQLQRDKGLFRSGMVSQQDVDNAAASVGDTNGQVEGAVAQLQQAQLNLSYTTVKSPIDGTAGLALVRVGNLVGQDQPTLLTTVSQIDPIRVNFPLSEIDYVKYPDRLKNFDGRDLAWAKKQFTELQAAGKTSTGDTGIQLLLSDGSTYGLRGVIVAADRQVDATTGTLQLQALVPNPTGALRPGQFGRVRLRRENEGKNALVVPEKALVSVQGSYSLGVVGPDNKVQMRHVDLGPTAPGFRVINSGVNEGERIVVEGVQKITDGATVNPQPAPPVPDSTALTTAATATTSAGATDAGPSQ